MPNLKGGPSGSRSTKRSKKDDLDDLFEEERFLSAVAPEDGDETCKTFLFKGEGHTLGNALRFVISSYPEVVFCAYTLPHPAEDVMHFRIQTVPGIVPQDILQRGLHDLMKLSEVVVEKFEEALAIAPPLTAEEELPPILQKLKSENTTSRSSFSKGLGSLKISPKDTQKKTPAPPPAAADSEDESDPECVDLA